ncbi:MAG: heavy metal translocating P-type ATPase [Candidatus Faecimonas sp.]|nr:cadmium-translocating P-type ATPase [Mycoplasmatota bacterium]MDY2908153.1 heavy metal translocating P-type ATPase [Candidatus Faecimonas sp.]
MTKKEKIELVRIIICMIVLLLIGILPVINVIKLILYIVAYLIVGYDVVLKAIRNVFSGKVFDEHFLMGLATIGAFITGEYLEAVLVMLLYQIGELFQSYAVGKSRRSITELMDIRPDYANIEQDGKLVKVDPEEISIGDKIVVKPGEKIPLDGIVEDGESMLDTSALTGESVPRKSVKGDAVRSGCINKTGMLTIKVTKEFEESTASKILDLVENASNKKAHAENFITKFAKYYTPIVVILALCLAFIPPLFIKDLTMIDCIKRAMTFLVISCPCALVISVPLGFFGGIGGASRQGILIKGSNYLETLANTKTIVFDKTGTLTEGKFQVVKIVSKEEKMLELAALAEAYSSHPIALAIREKYENKIKKDKVKDINELAGLGISAKIDNKTVYVGNEKLMEKHKIKYKKADEFGTIVYISLEKEFLGYIVIADKVKENAKEVVSSLKKKNHIKELIMLTGDKKEIAKNIADALGLDKTYSELLPKDKVDRLEIILKKQSEKEKVAFVGDGINDAPVLTRADIGIAMGALGSDAAIEAADVVIMDDDISKISTAINLSQRTIRIVKQNIYFAIGIKIFFLLLGALGIANMMEAVFADVGVSILAILNSMRALKTIKEKR